VAKGEGWLREMNSFREMGGQEIWAAKEDGWLREIKG
jgi:hypothetical protein